MFILVRFAAAPRRVSDICHSQSSYFRNPKYSTCSMYLATWSARMQFVRRLAQARAATRLAELPGSECLV